MTNHPHGRRRGAPLPPAPADGSIPSPLDLAPGPIEQAAIARSLRNQRVGELLALAVLVPLTLIVTSPLWWLAAHAIRWAVR